MVLQAPSRTANRPDHLERAVRPCGRYCHHQLLTGSDREPVHQMVSAMAAFVLLLLFMLLAGIFCVLLAIADAKCEILKAIDRQADPARVKQMTDDLREHTTPLAKAVEENKPLSG